MPALYKILAVTALIIELGRHMTRKENADTIVGMAVLWGGRHGRAMALMTLPALIGLAPMPAGALLSAPFVKEVGKSVVGESGWKTAVNYWFRHIWEYWWPLYPGVIVAMSLFDLAAWRFVALLAPFTIATIVLGYLALIRPRLLFLIRQIGPVPWGESSLLGCPD